MPLSDLMSVVVFMWASIAEVAESALPSGLGLASQSFRLPSIVLLSWHHQHAFSGFPFCLPHALRNFAHIFYHRGLTVEPLVARSMCAGSSNPQMAVRRLPKTGAIGLGGRRGQSHARDGMRHKSSSWAIRFVLNPEQTLI